MRQHADISDGVNEYGLAAQKLTFSNQSDYASEGEAGKIQLAAFEFLLWLLGNCRSIEDVRQALYAAKLVSYAQGFSLLKKASEHYQWNLDYGMLAKIWRKGCIIRSVFLEQITRAYHALPGLENLLFDDFFRNRILEALPAWRKITADCLLSGIPIPCMAAALTYFDGLRTERSSANLIQAQRDYFGAHTYERTDMERGQFFHTDWNETGGNVSGTYNA